MPPTSALHSLGFADIMPSGVAGAVAAHSANQSIRALEQDERIDRSAVSLLKELRALRNDAAHAPQFALSHDSALEYASVAENLVRYLRSIVDGT